MSQETTKAWKCSVCGYIHRGPEPPEMCPVCGSDREDFDLYTEPVARADAPAAQWRCLNCGYIHTGTAPTEPCPVCGAATDRFEPMAEGAEVLAGAEEKFLALVVGGGIAGISAVEALRQASSDAEITLVSREPHLPYYRLNLTRYLAGEIGADALPVHPESWYAEQNVQLKRGVEVSALDLDEREVTLSDGAAERFDKLIVTMGSHPFVPPLPGIGREGVFSLRGIHDAEGILDALRPGAKCVCVGGGILGLEAAGALARRGAEVSLLESYGWLLPRQLNQQAAARLESFVESLGVGIVRKARTEELIGDERVRAVQLADGALLEADLVVIATGVRSNSYLARRCGLEVGKGIVVDDRLRTLHPNVFAAGDVAEHRGVVYGTWIPSLYQGSIAGMNAAGQDVEFGGIPRSNTLKVLGLDLFSIGVVEPEDGSYEELAAETDEAYYRFLFHDSYLVGAILLGDTSLTAAVKKAVENKVDFSGLLRKRPGTLDIIEHLVEQAG